jgi:hypothetical protein
MSVGVEGFAVYLCYVDESGTSDIPGNSTHFVLAGISIPIWHWRNPDQNISEILARYGLADAEFHTAWILRKYLEQSRIPGFDALNYAQRRAAIERERNARLLQFQHSNQSKQYRQAKKNFAHESPYIHLTLDERTRLVHEVADCVAGWGSARLFAECIDKLFFDPSRAPCPVEEQAFEQVVSRFQYYVANTQEIGEDRRFGLLVHDNNQTVARKHTDLMRRFHRQGTLWTRIDRLIETPLFVNSELTRMVQVADLCAYALRRFLENQETVLFAKLFQRAHRIQNRVVGVRHFTVANCACEICRAHRPLPQVAASAPGAAAGGASAP